jgi:capsular polysaccharide transport system permease protein
LPLDHNFPRLAIDPDEFAQAVDSGAFDDCLRLLRDNATSPDIALLNRRLGEALFHQGRQDDALECARRAFILAPDDDDVANFCAWLFSNCHQHAEAAAVYERLVERHPDWIEGYRHLSGSLAASRALQRAIQYATKSADLASDNFDFAVHAGCLLLDAERLEEAMIYLSRAVEIEPENPQALRALSAAIWALDRPDEALRLALRAAAIAPSDSDVSVHAGELLLRAGRVEEAIPLLENAARSDSRNPTLWRLISTMESQRDCPEAALIAIGRAINLAPYNAEYHLHRGHLLYRIGDFDAAADAIAHAATLDPASHAAQRTQIDMLLADGRVTDATALGGELLRAFPEDNRSAETVLRVLNHRLDTVDGDYVVLGDRTHRLPQRPRPTPGFAVRVKTQIRVIQALIIRETRTRFGDSRLGYGWALLEPILHIALLSAVFSLLMRGSPPIGANFFVFYFTGLIPYHVFVHTSTSMTHGVISNAPILQLPLVTSFDVILARGILEFVTDIVAATILLAGFGAFGMPAMPDNLLGISVALIVTASLGCGVGFVNAVLQTLFRSWDKLWNNATRLFYFFSGIFYVPGMMPDWARDILVWNPLLHAIDWFRAAFYASYQPHWLDRRYLVICAFVALATGLGVERCLRRRLSEPL